MTDKAIEIMEKILVKDWSYSHGSASEVNEILHEIVSELRKDNKGLKEQNEDIKEQNETLKEQNKALKEQNEALKELNEALTSKLYGRSTEKTSVMSDDRTIYDMLKDAGHPEYWGSQMVEKVTEADLNPTEEKEPKKRTKKRRGVLEENLDEENIVYQSDDPKCPKCGDELDEMGEEEVRNVCFYKRGKFVKVSIKRKTYICKNCTNNESLDAESPDVKPCIYKAQVPPAVLPKTMCTPELLADLIYKKVNLQLPIERIVKDYANYGFSVSKTTLSSYIIKAYKSYGESVCELIREELLKYNVLQADETYVQVMRDGNRPSTAKSYVWLVTNTVNEDNKLFLYTHTGTRAGVNIAKILDGFNGYLVTDGFDGYNGVVNATRAGCLAHARRLFYNICKNMTKDQLKNSIAGKALSYCNELFRLERSYEARDKNSNLPKLSLEEKHIQRNLKSKPVIDAFFLYLRENITKVYKNTAIYKAIQYSLNEEKYLRRFLENGNIPIHNNRSENAIRPYVVGRKNWLFHGNVEGATAIAGFYSILTTAKENGWDVYEYLIKLFSMNTNGESTPPLPWKPELTNKLSLKSGSNVMTSDNTIFKTFKRAVL